VGVGRRYAEPAESVMVVVSPTEEARGGAQFNTRRAPRCRERLRADTPRSILREETPSSVIDVEWQESSRSSPTDPKRTTGTPAPASSTDG